MSGEAYSAPSLSSIARAKFSAKKRLGSTSTAATAESAFAPFVALELASIEAAGVFLS
jgi:hypothetical protein